MNLKLSELANKVYLNTDPMEIEEVETEDGYRYNITGCMEVSGLTESEVNEAIEDWIEEIDEQTIKEIAYSWICNADTTPGKIDLETAKQYVDWMDDKPLTITPEKFMDAWNSIISD